MLMLIAFVLVFLGSAVAGLVVSLRRPPASSLARRTLWLLTAIAALNAFFLVVFFVILQWVASGASTFAFNLGMPPALAALVAVPLLTSVLAVVLLALWLAGWRRRALSGRGVALVGSFVAVSLLFIPWLHTWNLLGFRW
jgi:hypothetical protein